MLAEIIKPGTLENIIIKAQHNCFSDFMAVFAVDKYRNLVVKIKEYFSF